jgi:Kef-type K+ transport system membrane component KefB
MFKYELGVGIRTGIILSQAGEFGFVILALGQKNAIITGRYISNNIICMFIIYADSTNINSIKWSNC